MSSSLDEYYDTESWKKEKLLKLIRRVPSPFRNHILEEYRISDLSTIQIGNGRYAAVWPYRSETAVLKMTMDKDDAENAAKIYASVRRFKHLVEILSPVLKLVDKDGTCYYVWRTKRLRRISLSRARDVCDAMYNMCDGKYKQVTTPWGDATAKSIKDELESFGGFGLWYDICEANNLMQDHKGVVKLHDFDSESPISGLPAGRIVLPSEL